MRHALTALAIIGLAGTPAQGRPKAAKGEPDIVRSADSYNGLKVYEQRFDGDPVTVSSLTIDQASWYRVLGEKGAIIPAGSVKVSCEIDQYGAVSTHTCLAEGTGSAPQQKSVLYAIKLSDALPDFAPFRPIEKRRTKKWVFTRSVAFDVFYPSINVPAFDLSTGPLVERELVNHGVGRLDNTYPSRALRQGIEGNQTVECQVQRDLSIICRSLDFNPAEHHALFARAPRHMLKGSRAAEKLADGRDAFGVRFRFRVAWRLGG